MKKLVKGLDLNPDDAITVMSEIMSGNATQAQIGAFLVSLRMKGETIPEISAFAKVMRQFCNSIAPKTKGRLVDVVGTGGDAIKTFNISTISALVVAGAGITVAKHGNRSVTSKCGSADVLEALGYNLNLEPAGVEKLIEEVGIGFMFAPKFHPAMKYAIGPRREIGVRTVFNILGPITNPANANALVLGVYSEKWLRPLTEVLQDLECEEAIVVYGEGGLDELSTVGKTKLLWLKDGKILPKEISPEDFGLTRTTPENISGSTSEVNADLVFQLLSGRLKSQDPKKEAVLLNAAAGITVGNKADTLSDGIQVALESIESGSAYDKLKQMIKSSGGDTSKIEELERKYA
jgi:anthranilate phosphoribosyltransferase